MKYNCYRFLEMMKELINYNHILIKLIKIKYKNYNLILVTTI